jgi:hypothetical protein
MPPRLSDADSSSEIQSIESDGFPAGSVSFWPEAGKWEYSGARPLPLLMALLEFASIVSNVDEAKGGTVSGCSLLH